MFAKTTVHTCKRCGFESPLSADTCQQCGYELHSSTRIRVLGGISLALGLLLGSSMVFLIAWTAGIILHSDDPHAAVRYTGDTGDTAFMYGVFGVVLLISVVAVLSGAWQLAYGRRNPRLVRAVLFLGLVFFVIGTLAQIFM